MPNYWITTHWPNKEPVNSPARHVFFKAGTRSQLPKPGDIVFIYETAEAVVDGKRVTHVDRCYQGKREVERLPVGRASIISKVVVSGVPRDIGLDDIVRDYGNLEEWQIIPCQQQTKVREVSKADLMLLLGYPRKTSPRFLPSGVSRTRTSPGSFWRVWKVNEGCYTQLTPGSTSLIQ